MFFDNTEIKHSQHVGILGIVVLEEFTGKGLGTILTRKIIEEAKRKMDTEIVTLCCDQYNKRAQDLYRKIGFKGSFKLRKGRKINGKYTDEVYMAKYLC